MPTIIGIAGPSAGGKTSVTQAIAEKVGVEEVLIIKYDDYYKEQSSLSFEEREKTNYDHPDAFDTDLLIHDLKKLKDGKDIEKPVYDFTNHTRKKEKEKISSRYVIIVEGIFTLLEEELRKLLDIKIYVYEDSDICFIRRLQRDTKERGRTIESVIEQYISTVKPMQEKFIEPTKKYADLILLHGKENNVGIQMVSENINKLLNFEKKEK